MKRKLFTLVATALVTSNSYATIISSRTMRYFFSGFDGLSFRCEPGVTANGHNFPTSSSIWLSNLSLIIGSTNVRAIGALDPSYRVGDLCNEMTQEFSRSLPSYFDLKQTMTETIGWQAGVCVKSYTEILEGTVGAYRFVGTAYFILGEVPGGCSRRD